jgi:hypothetical protein
MKANTKEINYAKMLKHCWGLLGSASRTLSREEFNQMQRAFAILLDTNILWLNHSYIDDILEKLEAKEITNSQAERIATRQLGVRPSVELEQRLADTNDCPDAVMQLFFGRDCRWTEGFNEWGNPKERRSTTYNNNKINF